MEALVRYDSSLVVGILGGSAGTTLDAFQMLFDAKKYGARVALYGRKINNAEHQLAFIAYLRAIADGEIGPVEAVKAYHGDLQKLGIKPKRSLEDDLQTTETSMSYAEKKTLSTNSTNVTNAPAQDAQPAAPIRELLPPRQMRRIFLRNYFRAANEEQKTKTSNNFSMSPDFSKMSQQEKLQWNLERIRRSM